MKPHTSLLVTFLIAAVFISGCVQSPPPPGPTVTPTPAATPPATPPAFTVSPPEEVLQANAFGLTDFPDGLLGVARKEGRYLLFLGAFPPGGPTKTHTFRFIGETLASLRPDPAEGSSASPVLAPGPPGSYDDQIAGNGAAYLDPRTGRLYLWYQAMKDIPEEAIQAKEAKLGKGNFYPGYSSGIGLAVSDDLGRTFRKMGVVLTIGLREETFLRDPSIAQADTFPPSVVRNGDFLYMYYSDYRDEDPATERIAAARLHVSDLDRTPQPWKKYHDGKFEEPSLGGRFTPIVEKTVFPSVSWNTHLNRWLMVHPAAESSEVLQWRTSEDGIRWSAPQLLVRSESARDWMLHPTIVGTGDDPSVTGKEFWVYYEHAPNERAYPPGGWLVRRKVVLPAR